MKGERIKNSRLNYGRFRNIDWLVTGVFILFLSIRIVMIFYPAPDIGGVEINIIYFIQRLLEKQPLYSDPEVFPYAVAQYSPLYYYLVAATASVFGTKPDELFSVFIVNRTVSLVLNLLYLVIVYRTSVRIFKLNGSAARSIVCFAFIFLEITSFGRPDSLYHLFFMLSLYYFFLCNPETAKGKILLKNILAAGIFTGLSICSKQSGIVLLPVFSIWLYRSGKIRLLLIYNLVAGLCILFILGLLLIMTGDFVSFYKNVIMGVSNGIGLHWYINVILPDFYYGFGLLFSLAGILLFFLMKKQQTLLAKQALLIFTGLFVLQNAVMAKFGSNPGYLTEWWTLLFILLAVNLQEIRSRVVHSGTELTSYFFAGILVVKIFLAMQPVYNMFMERPFVKMRQQYREEAVLAAYLKKMHTKERPIHIFCNFYTPEHFLSGFLFREAVMPQMDIVGLLTYKQGLYSYQAFRNEISEGRIPVMIMRTTGAQKQFFDLRLDNFKKDSTIAGFNIYLYAGLPK